MNFLQLILAPLAASGASMLEASKPQLLALANSATVKVADMAVAFVAHELDVLSAKEPQIALLAPVILDAIKAKEPEIEAAIASQEGALVDLLAARAEQIIKSL